MRSHTALNTGERAPP